MAESEIQLLTEGSGPKVRTLEVTEPSAVDSTGAAQADDTRHQQVVGLADRAGDLADDPNRLLAAIYEAQLRTNVLLELVLGSLK